MFTIQLSNANPSHAILRTRSKNVSFNDYYASYAQRQIWQPQTARSVNLAARQFPGGPLPLADIDPPMIEQWVKSMHDDGLMAGTIHTRVGNVSAVLACAARDGLIPSNPTKGVRLPRTTMRAVRTMLPTAEQVRDVVLTSTMPYKGLIALAAYAGLRFGEAAALKWDDVDVAKQMLTVRHQAQLVPGGGVVLVPPKYGSYRSVPLEPELGEVLKDLRGLDAELVAPGHAGAPLHPGSVHREWSRLRAQCDLPEGLHLHDLRHWFASRLIARGESVLTVQRRLGHARPSTTLDVYGHCLDPDQLHVASSNPQAAPSAYSRQRGSVDS